VAFGDEWTAIREQAAALIRSKFLPRAIDTPEKCIAIMLAGRELGLPPMQSVRAISIVEGKPTLSAETMLALAYQRVPGLVVEVVTTPTGATVTGNRPGGKPVTVTFGQAQAKAAGLLSKQNWQKYPEAMYRARAISAWCRVVAPDAILGAYTPEEVESIRPSSPTPIAVLPPETEYRDDPRPTQEEPQASIGPNWPDDEQPGPVVNTETQEPPEPPQNTAGATISEPQRRRLYALSKAAQATQNWEDDHLATIMAAVLERYGYKSTKEIERKDYDAICAEVQSWK
jgi:hypothetical protein